MIHSCLETITALRRTLHGIPEPSMQEEKTKAALLAFLRKHTTCEIRDCGSWFYALHRCDRQGAPTVAFRADMDAVLHADTVHPFHGCGHDGHAACVAGLALLNEALQRTKNIVYLFQPGEETGEGALLCRSVIEREKVDVIYGCHTIPGYPAGEILFRRDVFACASRGMILRFRGKQCHAAYPETGHNPAFAVSRVTDALYRLLHDSRSCSRGMVLATVVGIRVGAKAFGVSAGDGELYLTVRAHYEEDLEALVSEITAYAHACCEADALTLEVSFVDVFPDTVNDADTVDAFFRQLRNADIPVRPLSEPMRWSEDFGWYAKETKACFFGIGAGLDYPALHTDAFCYNDALIERTEEVFLTLCRN